MRESSVEKIRRLEAPVDVRDALADLEELAERLGRALLCLELRT